jgi:hypothetical protein
LESPGLDTLTRILTQPGEQARELQQGLLSVVNTPDASASAAAADVAVGVVDQVAQNMAARAGLDVDVLFPVRRFMLQSVNRAALAGDASSMGSTSSNSSSSSTGLSGSSASIPLAAALNSSSSSSHRVEAGSSNSSSGAEPVLQEAAQVALAAAGSGVTVSKTNGKVMRMRQL